MFIAINGCVDSITLANNIRGVTVVRRMLIFFSCNSQNAQRTSESRYYSHLLFTHLYQIEL